MDLDPDLAEVAPLLPHFDYGDALGAREAVRRLNEEARAGAIPDSRVAVEAVLVPVGAGGPDVPVRVYAPIHPTGGMPGLLFIHGGGFILGDLDSEDARCRRMAIECQCVVVSVGYRLAPEDPFPAAVEDCYHALTWTSARSDELGFDPSRLGVAGVSSGGGLAAAVVLMARDRGTPALRFQHLVYPVLDDRMETGSMKTFVDVPCWTSIDSGHMWHHYLSGNESSDTLAYAAPARASTLEGLPPTYLMTAEFDPLRDEGIAFALRLLEAGVPTELHNYPGAFHGFDVVAPDVPISRRAVAEQIDALQRGLSDKV